MSLLLKVSSQLHYLHAELLGSLNCFDLVITGYPPEGYPPQGYPPQGYPPQGYPQQSYPPPYAPQYPPPQQNQQPHQQSSTTGCLQGWYVKIIFILLIDILYRLFTKIRHTTYFVIPLHSHSTFCMLSNRKSCAKARIFFF